MTDYFDPSKNPFCKSMGEKVDRLCALIYGNGSDGMKQEIAVTKTITEQLLINQRELSDDLKSVNRRIMGLMGMILIAGLSVVAAFVLGKL